VDQAAFPAGLGVTEQGFRGKLLSVGGRGLEQMMITMEVMIAIQQTIFYWTPIIYYVLQMFYIYFALNIKSNTSLHDV
jgi:hypothetical protein